MPDYFFDTSALVKRYVTETGTAWVQSIFAAPDTIIYLARVTGAESAAAIMRRVRRGDILATDAAIAIGLLRGELISVFDFVEITPALVSDAIESLHRQSLRGYDAIQLAAALTVRKQSGTLGSAPPIFVAADRDLLAAATAEGMSVDNPNLH